MTLKIGQVVTLKSGGPKMTVIATTRDDTKALCTWFDGSEFEPGKFVYHGGEPHEMWVKEEALSTEAEPSA